MLDFNKKKNSKYEVNMEFYNVYFRAIRKQLVDDLADGTSKLTISPGTIKGLLYRVCLN